MHALKHSSILTFHSMIPSLNHSIIKKGLHPNINPNINPLEFEKVLFIQDHWAKLNIKTMRLTIITLFILLSSTLDAQIGRIALSPFQKTEQKIGNTDITISNSRPSMRGRVIFGGLVPYNKLWRTGANRNTKIEFSEDVMIAGRLLGKGEYAIFTIPKIKEWDIIFYDETIHWDVPRVIDSTKIVARITVPSRKIPNKKESLAITIGEFTNYKFNLDIEWENTAVSVPIDLNTAAQMEAKITKQLSGPDDSDYYLAALYEIDAGHNYENGLTWIDKAIELSDQEKYWHYWIKARLLVKVDRIKEAKVLAEKGLVIVKPENREFMISEFEGILELEE